MKTDKILNSVLIKPAGPDCNLNCSYCFYLKKRELFDKIEHRMSEDLLESIISQVIKGNNRVVNFTWQGGEPSLAGIPFYKKAVYYQNLHSRPGQLVINGFQTNGILIDRDWAQFLSDANFVTGLSLDGPEHIHDRYRLKKGGGSTWSEVCRARDLLLKHNVEVNALVVVNDYSVKFPEEIYNFHKSNGLLYMQFIPCIEGGRPDEELSICFKPSAEEYGLFLCTLFDLWVADFSNGQPATYIEYFNSVLQTYLGELPASCTLLEECGLYLVVEHNGNVYSCDFFVDEDNYLGNMRETSLSDLLNSEKQSLFGQIKKKLHKDCIDCPWLTHCYGGCPANRATGKSGIDLPYYCRSFKMFFEHADSVLGEIAEQVRTSDQAAGDIHVKK